jgi:pimeloyl-ACP methyl ester carboxylesterase
MPFTTSRDGTRIGYSVTGTGPVIVLVDGALCYRTSGPMGPISAQLKDRYTVVTYDRRGRGESGDTKPYDPQREIEDLEAVIDANGGQAALFAISSGVVLALSAANAVPDKISKMVLYEAPLLTDDTRHADPAYASTMYELIDRGDTVGAVKHFLGAGVGVPRYALLMMGLFGLFRKLASVGATLAYDTRIIMPYWTNSPPPKTAWAHATMPVLAIGGGKSDSWMQNAQVNIAKALPNATHQTLPGQNHMVSAAAIAPMIKAFVA